MRQLIPDFPFLFSKLENAAKATYDSREMGKMELNLWRAIPIQVPQWSRPVSLVENPAFTSDMGKQK